MDELKIIREQMYEVQSELSLLDRSFAMIVPTDYVYRQKSEQKLTLGMIRDYLTNPTFNHPVNYVYADYFIASTNNLADTLFLDVTNYEGVRDVIWPGEQKYSYEFVRETLVLGQAFFKKLDYHEKFLRNQLSESDRERYLTVLWKELAFLRKVSCREPNVQESYKFLHFFEKHCV